VGILPAGPPPGYPNPFVDVVIQTHLPKRGNQGSDILSRNHITVLSSAVVVVLPGRQGTRTELALAIHHRKPVIAFLGPEGEIEGELRMAMPAVANSLDEVTAFICSHCGGG
jgi:predicted Rossmann-fold nucleotide-binding protein